MTRRESAVQVELPPAGADEPPWAKVGVIAVVGFVVGVAWPRLAGFSLGPNPPSDARREAPTATAAPPSSGSKPSSTGSLPANAMVVPMGSTGAPGSSFEQTVVVGPVEQGKCRGEKGKTPDKCDDLAVDPLFVPRLKELAKCPSAIGLSGKLSFGFDLDFKGKTIKVQRPKSKLPRTTIDGITRCAERGLSGVSLDEIAHQQQRYSLAYTLSFYPPGKAPEAGDSAGDKPAPAASGSAAAAPGEAPSGGKAVEVKWNSIQVRETPKDGAVVGKLTKGQKATVLEQKDGWAKIEFGESKKQGWVKGDALGL